MLIHQACTAKLFALKCTDNHYNNIGDRKQIVSGMSIKHKTLMCIITKIRRNTIIYKKQIIILNVMCHVGILGCPFTVNYIVIINCIYLNVFWSKIV